jgi:hypothetical protein
MIKLFFLEDEHIIFNKFPFSFFHFFGGNVLNLVFISRD